ncbi:MAG: cell wall metabolism sensor histidine kinase WalK [Clostridiales bacterium]|nr:cell wall metabolism sensor histidine kinase WalK [Clostridiales bacterium]
MKSIKFKLIFLYLALVFIVMLVSGTFMLVSIRVQELDKLETELRETANHIYYELLSNPDKNEEDFPDELANIVRASGNSLEAAILNKDGYNLNPESGPSVYKSTAVTGAMLGKPAFDSNKWSAGIGGGDNEAMAYAMPYPYNPNINLSVQYIIYLRISMEAVQSRLQEVTLVLALAVIIALILTFIIGLLFAATLTGPIVMLTTQAKDLAQGGETKTITVKSKDEIGQLTETFNEMAQELSYTMESITTEKNKMEILLYNMTDGVLAYGKGGELIEANYMAQEQLLVNNIRELSFLELSKEIELNIEEFDIEKLKEMKDMTVTVGDKFISLIFSPYYNIYDQIDGVVIVLHDITKHKKLDEMRKEFVANVSHEIRTPLTTIKSYAETLLSGGVDDAEMAGKFLGIIEKEADRMTLLVQDLLELSRFDNSQYSLDLKRCNLNEIVENAVLQVSVLAQMKNQKINYAEQEVANPVMADSKRINQVLVNILGNAVKYSPENTQINVTTEKTDRFYRVYIKDNGFGIPKDDLVRIFERFYRVDKARSREMGGTGLGLSIAKEIMEAHGFRISATSEPGKGTTMILRFDRLKD